MADVTTLAEVAEAVRVSAKLAPTIAVSADSRLIEDLGIDSLDLVGVFLQVQDRFGVIVEDDDIPRLRTIRELTQYVESRRHSSAA